MTRLNRFTKRYKTFTAWKKATKNSRYKKRILRAHLFNPRSPLKILRKLRIRDVDLSKVPIWKLTKQGLINKERAMAVLSSLREDIPMTQALREIGINLTEVRKHLGRFIFKEGGRWIAKKTDTLQRRMEFYENGRITTIITTTFDDSSTVGRYLNAVKRALESHDPSLLDEFADKVIVDAHGKKRRFEVDLDNLSRITEQMEDREVRPPVYRYDL